jgi:soluble lytic murein transglycosylase
VLKVESDFDNRAVNPRSGAFTMAQFLPGTWEEWKVNGNPDQGPTIDPADVADVIFSAARYLCGLGAGTPDTQRLAVAAYNAGPTRVREWWGARKSDDLEVWVEQIPYNETRNFVRRVMVGWEEYRRLYADAGSPATVTR